MSGVDRDRSGTEQPERRRHIGCRGGRGRRLVVLLAVVCLGAPCRAPFGSAARAAEAADCPRFFPGGQPPALLNPKLVPRTTLLCNDAYASLASGITRGALWSAEHPTAASLAAARHTPREGEFHSDDRLPAADRGELADYHRSGFDRGHMAPSGDMPDEAAQGQSFSLANMVPQRGALNRGVWAGIEMAVRELAEREGELFVVTGPAFKGKRLRTIGPDAVLVPSSTWKAVYDPRTGGTGVYVCKNTNRPTCDTVSVAALERNAGIDPFPALAPDAKATAMALPPPEDSPYAPGHGGRHGAHDPRQPRGLLQQLLDLDH
ncbi:MAG: DNA/RNA non-specific endonuclease [Gluconacetobacter diazotrophicus]|nr:DNA/RNA non-specific endonuclease [Gluconacetobacter diazotrophicus]